MPVARRDGRDARGQAQDVDRDEALGRRAVADLAEAVDPPAPDPAARGEGARVALAGRHGDDARRQAHDVDRDVALGRRAIAELAIIVAAPALDPAGEQ